MPFTKTMETHRSQPGEAQPLLNAAVRVGRCGRALPSMAGLPQYG
jgi:hypothetical protein